MFVINMPEAKKKEFLEKVSSCTYRKKRDVSYLSRMAANFTVCGETNKPASDWLYAWPRVISLSFNPAVLASFVT